MNNGDMYESSNPIKSVCVLCVCMNVFHMNGLALAVITLILFRQRSANQQNGRTN